MPKKKGMKGSGKKAKPKKSLTPSSSPLHPSTSSHTLELSPEGTILLPVIVQSDLPPNELYLSPSLVQSLDLLPACYIALTFPNGQSILTRLSTASKGLASFAEYKRVAVLNKIWTPNLICAVEGLEEGDRSITLDMALLKRSRILPCQSLYISLSVATSTNAISDPIYLLSYIKEVILGCCISHFTTIHLPYKGNKVSVTLHVHIQSGDADVGGGSGGCMYFYEVCVSTRVSMLPTHTPAHTHTSTPSPSPTLSYESVLYAVQEKFAGFDAEVELVVKIMYTSLFPSNTHTHVDMGDVGSHTHTPLHTPLGSLHAPPHTPFHTAIPSHAPSSNTPPHTPTHTPSNKQSSTLPHTPSSHAPAKKYKGLILSGPPGSGKSLLAQCVCAHLGIHTITLDPTTLYNTQTHTHTQLEDSLRKIFSMARESAPCVILMDHIHLLLPSRASATVSTEMKRFVSCWLTLVDGSEQLDGVFILGLTSSVDDLDPAARRAGRIDLEVELPVPTSVDRLCILQNMLKNCGIVVMKDEEGVVASTNASLYMQQSTLQYVATNAHGMVGSDLLLLIKEACYFYTKRIASIASSDMSSVEGIIQGVGSLNLADMTNSTNSNSPHVVLSVTATPSPQSPSPSPSPLLHLEVTLQDFQSALRTIKPSAIREVAIEVPKVYWSDIGGMEGVKKAVRQVIEYPLLYPEVYQKMSAGDVNSLKGVLLYGPPGCSKTLLAKAIATETSMNFLAVRGPELLSKWVGESEKAVQRLFKRARAVAPAIVFFDEIDALAGVRGDKSSGVSDRVLSQLLTELDGIQGWRQVIVIAATNRPDMLDPALIRPGRIDRKIYVPPPDDASRQSILQLELSKLPLQGDIDSRKLVQMSKGYSGAEMVSICNDAALQAIESNADYVTDDMLTTACKKITPQITKDMISFYENFRSKNRTF